LHSKIRRKSQEFKEKVSPKLIFITCFSQIFFGEWGDKSQITTVAMSASNSTVIVFLGTLVGHFFCTGLAVLGGNYFAEKISEKVLNLLGGTLMLFFGL
jgi:putative Ca2+/H+ antiporter (TMEM165/GDT1 family)